MNLPESLKIKIGIGKTYYSTIAFGYNQIDDIVILIVSKNHNSSYLDVYDKDKNRIVLTYNDLFTYFEILDFIE